MDFFDSLIKDVYALTDNLQPKSYDYNEENAREDLGYNQVILQRDSAYVLSGTGFNLVTSSDVKQGIVVVGKDMQSIKKNQPFARISVVQIDEQSDEQSAYNLIRKIEYVKYHYFPEGYMIRTTSRSHKESVRVSKKSLKNGMNFEQVGSLLISRYKQIPQVKNVCVIFITDENADFSFFEKLAKKNNDITETLNHIMNNVVFDCDTCNLKAVCDEVEGLKELHFKNRMGM